MESSAFTVSANANVLSISDTAPKDTSPYGKEEKTVFRALTI